MEVQDYRARLAPELRGRMEQADVDRSASQDGPEHESHTVRRLTTDPLAAVDDQRMAVETGRSVAAEEMRSVGDFFRSGQAAAGGTVYRGLQACVPVGKGVERLRQDRAGREHVDANSTGCKFERHVP